MGEFSNKHIKDKTRYKMCGAFNSLTAHGWCYVIFISINKDKILKLIKKARPYPEFWRGTKF